jgi:hypothetical protein
MKKWNQYSYCGNRLRIVRLLRPHAFDPVLNALYGRWLGGDTVDCVVGDDTWWVELEQRHGQPSPTMFGGE